jgi:hypothetical protein
MDNMQRTKPWSRILLILAAAVGLALGCDSPKDGAKKKTDQKEETSHTESAPHKGKLFADDGDRHHAELLIDQAGKKATVYLYDSKIKDPVSLGDKTISLNVADKAPVQIELKAEPQKADPEGMASRFSGVHDRLGTDLDLGKVEIEAKINGKSHVFKLDKD